MRKVFAAALAGVSVAAMAAPALAQDDTSDDEDRIVVVGTMIRGTEAVGSQPIVVGSESITQQSANSTNQVLGLIPQISNTFNGRFEGDPRGVGAGISITKPNLRGLPGFNSASGGVTLVLVDGFRIAPVGVGQASIDVDIIPASVLEGVDVLTDGGSSLYGADAVGGVINFRTRRTFDGIEVSGTYGLGDTISAHQEYDASIIAGTSWDGGNAFVSVGYSHRDLIRNGDVDWADGTLYDADGNPFFDGTQCPDPVGTETRWFNFGAGFTNNPLAPGAGTFPVGTACETFSQGTYLPEQDRYNVFGSLTQQVNDNIDLRVTAYWTKREQELANFPRGFTTAGSGITSGAELLAAFPEAASTPLFSTFAVPEGIGFAFSPNSAYQDVRDVVGFETWGVTPEITWNLGNDWQVRTTVHLGRSSNRSTFAGVNSVLAQSYVDSGALDPLNVAAADASVITDVLDFETRQDTIHELFVARSVIDGPIFTLPGGDARVAVGVEYQDAGAKTRVGAGRVGAVGNQIYRSTRRHSEAVFAEVVLPVVDMLEVAGSVRYDHYSDFGSTTNPNIGVSFTPTDWLEIYGHWNTSFNAPTALDALAQAVGRFTSPIYTPTAGPNDPFGQWDGTGTRAFIAEGPKPGLEPQEAESWSVGIEVTPTDGLRFGGQFYSIDFDNILGAVNPTDLQTYVLFPELYIFNPSDEFFAAFLSEMANGDVLAQQVTASEIALLVDRRTSNISSAVLEGVDFHVYYDAPTSFGSISLGLNGNVPTKASLSTGSATQDLLPQGADFIASAYGGVTVGDFSGRLTVNYTDGLANVGPDNTGTPASASAFVQTNLFLGYSPEEGPLRNTSLRIIVDNIFDEEPTRVRRSAGSQLSYVNWTLGRVIKFGITQRFR